MIKRVLKKRCILVSVIFTLIFLSIIFFSLIKIQYSNSNELRVLAEKQYTVEENTDELKYKVFDNEGKDLLEYKINYTIVIEPYTFKVYNEYTKKEDMDALEYILSNYDSKYKVENFTSPKNNGKVYFDVNEDTYKKLKMLNVIKGMYLYTYTSINRKGAWNIESLITTTTKNVGKDVVDKDINSLEMRIKKVTGDNKHNIITFEKGIDGFNTEGQSTPISGNVNIRLTIDKNMQDTIKEVLSSEKYSKYDQVGALVMESSSGKIKAMALKDDKKPNVILGSTTENGFEPGSIFKVIVEETGLDSKSISVQDKFTCESGKNSLCKEVHGSITPEEALIISCNNAFTQMGKKVKFANFKAIADSQGLFKKVLNIDSEVKGDYIDPNNKPEGDRFLSIGQNMRITPIQAISIANTVINKGVYVKPYLIDAYVDNNNKVQEQFSSDKHSVISENTSNIMKDQMINVVKLGTGKLAAVSNVEIGGKTGTNERVETKINNDKKVEKHSDGWFVGFFKINNKYYTIVVFVKDININGESGGTTAAPIFRDSVSALKKYIKK